jgi:hypothetical protein
VLTATVVHSRRRDPASNEWTERYIVGCEFQRGARPGTDEAIEALLEILTGTLSFD